MINKHLIRYIVFSTILLSIALYLYTYHYHFYERGEQDAFKLKLGQTLSLKFDENQSTGYNMCWLSQNSFDNVQLLHQNSLFNLRQITGCNGCGNTVEFVYKAIKPGIDTINITNCPCGVERKECEDYDIDSVAIHNRFVIEVVE